jgi:ribosomal protein S18 acetylase RimI-like enzyme
MEDIEFTSSLESVGEAELQGFFVGWQHAPTPAKHLDLLRNSSHIVLAVDTQTKKVVGFITAITDKTLAAYIPFLEVLPAYKRRGSARN